MSSLPSSMRAPKFVGQGRIEFTEKSVPAPGPGQLLLRVHANALCGSERFQFESGWQVTPGHEAAGVVAACGAGTRTAAGTPGLVFLMDFCGECRACRQGLTNQCLHKRADMGFSHDGGYGVYELIHENIFFPVPAEIPADEATLLLDIMGTGGHALKRAQLVRSDIESVLVLGAGPIGLGVLAMARLLLGPRVPVLISDVIPYRLELAERLGGVPVNVQARALEEQIRAHEAAGVDVVVDSTGKGAARQAGLRVLGKRGVFVCVGHGEGLNLNVSPDLIAPERAVLGSEYFCYGDLAANLALLQKNRAYLKQIITHRFPVAELQTAFVTFFGGNTGKVIAVQ
jgi:threonine 3-dehydrogenase